MKTELYYRGKFIGRFATTAEAVHHYIDHLYVRGVNKFCDGVVLRDECGYCTIRSQFVGTRKPRQFMMASRFGGILFDTMDSKKMNKAKLEKIRKDVLTIISEQFGVKFDDIKDTDTADSLGGDSLDSVECAMALEEHFEVEIEDSVIEEWKNVGECIQYFIDSERGLSQSPAPTVKKSVHPSTVNAVKKVPKASAFDVPSIAGFAHRAEVEFKQIKFRFGNDSQKTLKKVGDAEQKATDKALAAGVKADKLTTAIVAENKQAKAAALKRPAPSPATKRIIDRMRARRFVVSAQHLVDAAVGFSTSKYYVVDVKRDRVMYGPFVRESEARRMSNAQKNCIVMTGRGCRNNFIRYDTKFMPTKRPRVTSGMFAPGSAVIIGGKATKVIRYDKKNRIVVTPQGDRFMADFGFDFNKAKPACM